jgi:hypothetical protein
MRAEGFWNRPPVAFWPEETESRESSNRSARTELGSMETSIKRNGEVIQCVYFQPRVVLSVSRGTPVGDGRKELPLGEFFRAGTDS